jgi:hypothetical protein
MRALPVLLFLAQSGGLTAKSKCQQTDFSIKITIFQPVNETPVY